MLIYTTILLVKCAIFMRTCIRPKKINDNDIDNYLQTIDIEKTLNDEEKLFVINFLHWKNALAL